ISQQRNRAETKRGFVCLRGCVAPPSLSVYGKGTPDSSTCCSGCRFFLGRDFRAISITFRSSSTRVRIPTVPPLWLANLNIRRALLSHRAQKRRPLKQTVNLLQFPHGQRCHDSRGTLGEY